MAALISTSMCSLIPLPDKVQIFANQQGEHNLTITDIAGSQITATVFDDNVIINTGKYSKGVYLLPCLIATNPGDKITRKFVVE